MRHRISTSTVLGLLAIAFLWAPAARAQVTLVNPDWDITLTDYGYSDLLIFNSGAFPPAFLHEMLSGEWGAAIAYDGLPVPETAMWLDPMFLAPDWATNSNFGVVTPLTDLGDPDGDLLPEWFSIIGNAEVEIRIDYDMDDTATGTPMGLRSGTFVLSNRYVLHQTYTITNISGGPLDDVRIFQLLHAHPGNDESASVSAVYDPDLHPGALSAFRYDITQSSLTSGAINGAATGWVFNDHVGFHHPSVPDDWGLGHYRGTAGKPADTDVEPDGDGDGAHFEVERDTLENELTYGPDEVGGSMRVDFGTIPDGDFVVAEFMLTVASEVVDEPDPNNPPYGPTFSIDFHGPSVGAPDGFFGLPILESTILTPTPPGAPGPNPAAFGPLPSPGTMFYGVSPTRSLGVMPPPGLGGEIDALSYGHDTGGQLLFSVDEFAVGVGGFPAPDVASEGAGGAGEASADVFLYVGAVAPTPPGPAGPGNTAFFDGNGVAPPAGIPGFGLIEPDPPGPGLPDAGDNLDAFDHDTILPDVFGPVFFSLDSAFGDPIEGPPANTGTAVANGFSGADVLVSVLSGLGGTPPAIAIPALALGLDLAGFDTDDLDALIFDDADGSKTLTAGDTVYFSVRRGSAVIGAPDSAFGAPIVEGDVLTLPTAAGLPPAIFISAEALALIAPRGMPQPGDDLDALDLPEPGSVSGLLAGGLLLASLARRRRR